MSSITVGGGGSNKLLELLYIADVTPISNGLPARQVLVRKGRTKFYPPTSNFFFWRVFGVFLTLHWVSHQIDASVVLSIQVAKSSVLNIF